MIFTDKQLIFVVIIAAIVLYFIGLDANAGEYRLGSMNNSHHFQDRKEGEHNEVHSGAFVEIRLSPEHWAGYMDYVNSSNQDSETLYLLTEYELNKYIYYGYLIGIVSGYGDDITQFGALTLTTGGNNIKSRVIIIPTIVISYQLLWEF